MTTDWRALERELHVARGAGWPVVLRHARTFTAGDGSTCARLCQAGAYDRATGETHSEGKVIYDTREAAEACAAELRELGLARQWAYRCPRSRRGHHHLTRKPQSGSEAKT